jgi:hypothetical protein
MRLAALRRFRLHSEVRTQIARLPGKRGCRRRFKAETLESGNARISRAPRVVSVEVIS